MELTSAEARQLLDVQEPHKVAWTSKDGTKRDDDGDEIDDRKLKPWVLALGPFGSWPVPLTEAEGELATHDTWQLGKSFRLNWVVTWKSGWGFAADLEKVEATYPDLWKQLGGDR